MRAGITRERPAREARDDSLACIGERHGDSRRRPEGQERIHRAGIAAPPLSEIDAPVALTPGRKVGERNRAERVAGHRGAGEPREASQCAAAAAAAAAAASAARAGEAGLRRGAVHGERGELLQHLGGAAARAGDDLRLAADELVEVLLALHARVLVDRHRRVYVSPETGGARVAAASTGCVRMGRARRLVCTDARRPRACASSRSRRTMPTACGKRRATRGRGSGSRSRSRRRVELRRVPRRRARRGHAGTEIPLVTISHERGSSARRGSSRSAPSTGRSRSAGRGSIRPPGAPESTSRRSSSCSGTRSRSGAAGASS